MLSEAKDEDNPLRSPLGNGKLIALAKVVIPAVVSALIIGFPAWVTMSERVTQVETNERNHFEAVLREMDKIDTNQSRQIADLKEDINEALKELKLEIRRTRNPGEQ